MALHAFVAEAVDSHAEEWDSAMSPCTRSAAIPKVGGPAKMMSLSFYDAYAWYCPERTEGQSEECVKFDAG